MEAPSRKLKKATAVCAGRILPEITWHLRARQYLSRGPMASVRSYIISAVLARATRDDVRPEQGKNTTHYRALSLNRANRGEAWRPDRWIFTTWAMTDLKNIMWTFNGMIWDVKSRTPIRQCSFEIKASVSRTRPSLSASHEWERRVNASKSCFHQDYCSQETSSRLEGINSWVS